MSDTVARRYAQALSDEAAAKGVTHEVDADIELIRSSLESSRELVRFFESPIIPRERKQSVVRELFGGRLRDVTLKFLEILVAKRREVIFSSIVAAYRKLRDEKMGIVQAHARVARPLSENDERAIVNALEGMTGKKVRLAHEVDRSLLGGLVIRIDDTVYDGSLSNKLDALREQFFDGSYRNN